MASPAILCLGLRTQQLVTFLQRRSPEVRGKISAPPVVGSRSVTVAPYPPKGIESAVPEGLSRILMSAPEISLAHLTDEQFDDILSLKYEPRGVEFKGPGPASDRRLVAQVTRAMIGMANRRDGGHVVIGVSDQGGVLLPEGLSVSDIGTWKHDDIASKLAEYADPSISFESEVRQSQSRNYILLVIAEFEDIPILCKKDYPEVLRKGACYVRSRRKPETTEIPTQEDMRDLISLATEKGLRKYFATSRAVGVEFSISIQSDESERFDEQISDMT